MGQFEGKTFRLAQEADLPQILRIYSDARNFMAQVGNAVQWGDGYPHEVTLAEDIATQKLWLCIDANERIEAVFFFDIMDEPVYHVIEGSWMNDETYGVIHRIAVASQGRGVGALCTRWALEQCRICDAKGGVRIDTHELNKPMQNMLKRLGFSVCGTVYYPDGTPRIAFQSII